MPKLKTEERRNDNGSVMHSDAKRLVSDIPSLNRHSLV